MVRLGIAGIGTIAKDYIGLIAGGQVGGVKLTALCSRNRESARQMDERYGLNSRIFQDYGEMLRSGLVDGVLICTPHGQHPAMALQAVEAGIHVLVEKPAGILEEEVGAVLRALEQRPGLVCGVLYNRRASRAFRYVKGLVESGEIGELVRCTWIITDLYRTNAYYTSGSWRGTWRGEGGGLLMTQASHQLDLMQWICGMPSSVLARCSSVGRPIQVENEAELLLAYPRRGPWALYRLSPRVPWDQFAGDLRHKGAGLRPGGQRGGGRPAAGGRAQFCAQLYRPVPEGALRHADADIRRQ